MLITVVLAAIPVEIHGKSRRQNWFNDPFFQISDAVAGCPQPVGPFVTEKQRLVDAHHRAERGTICWLAGKCDRPSSYDYDHDIAAAFKAALKADNPFHRSTLWVTVQGRVVYIEGCAEENDMTARAEAYAWGLPYVEMAVAKIRSDPQHEPPYPVLPHP